MEMKDFASKIRDSVRDGLGDGYKVDVKEVNKNNSVVRNGLVILAQGQNVAPTIYLEDFLEAYESGMPLETVVQQMLDAYRRSMPADGLDMDFFRHFQKVRDRICFRLIGKKGNEALLEKIPYIDFLDLAICFYYAYQDESLGEGSILIYNSHVEMWGTNAFELMNTARRNTPRLLPWTCCSLAEAMEAAGGESDAELDGFLAGLPMKVLSNTKQVHGAACILYPGVLEALAQEGGCGFYILPSSIHEVMLLPDTDGHMSADCLKLMIVDVNSTIVAPEEVLSDTLYYYDADQKRVRQIA